MLNYMYSNIWSWRKNLPEWAEVEMGVGGLGVGGLDQLGIKPTQPHLSLSLAKKEQAGAALCQAQGKLKLISLCNFGVIYLVW